MSILGDCRVVFSASGAAYVGLPGVHGSPQPLEQIDRAIVRDFGLPAVINWAQAPAGHWHC